MPQIEILDQGTIDKIAAGEVIERPASVVKELVENAIDAKAGAITVEIKEGGISFIRITDNGCGIIKEQVPVAFLRHSTSKIRSVEDLFTVSSLGFRGEALSSIAAISQVEMITKAHAGISGTRYLIEGGKEVLPPEKPYEEIGAPDGTTFLVRNLFYNTPARRKFLKSHVTEAGYINDLMERLALSHPEVSFKFIVNNQVKLHTSGNSNLKEIIYHIYGREIAANLIELHQETKCFSIDGFIGKPSISRGNRNFENYFINGRYVKSSLIAKGIEDGYKSFSMQHKYPFVVLHLSIHGQFLDVNVHPTKMELRFTNQEEVYETMSNSIREALHQSELVYQIKLQETMKTSHPGDKGDKKQQMKEARQLPEPFEKRRLESLKENITKDSPYEPKYSKRALKDGSPQKQSGPPTDNLPQEQSEPSAGVYRQVTLEDNANKSCMKLKEDMAPYGKKLLDQASRKYHTIIGQLFGTYWLVEFEEKLYMIDQHAAHEKVLYERTMASLQTKEFTSQIIYPPILITVSMQEEEMLKKYQDYFETLGFALEHFGGKEYAVTAVPGNLFGLNGSDLILEILDGLMQFSGNETPQGITEKIASMSCKAAVKGNQKISRQEMEHLIDELLTLDNPYHCPHGRPTIISMTKYELEKKFKRVQ